MRYSLGNAVKNNYFMSFLFKSNVNKSAILLDAPRYSKTKLLRQNFYLQLSFREAQTTCDSDVKKVIVNLKPALQILLELFPT